MDEPKFSDEHQTVSPCQQKVCLTSKKNQKFRQTLDSKALETNVIQENKSQSQ